MRQKQEERNTVNPGRDGEIEKEKRKRESLCGFCVRVSKGICKQLLPPRKVGPGRVSRNNGKSARASMLRVWLVFKVDMERRTGKLHFH